MTRKTIKTTEAPAAIGPYSQAVETGELMFISGQLAIDPASGKLIDGDIGARTRKILENAAAIANKGGRSLGQVVKTTIFLTDLRDFQKVNEAYAAVFTEDPPARSTVQVAALPLGADIEIEFILAN